MRKVTVIDYGVGNLLSVQRGLEHCGGNVIVTANQERILSSERVVLPGVGAFSDAMNALNRLNLVDTIRQLAEQSTPLLGICLGMQLLLEQSDEFGISPGLGLIPGKVIPIPRQDQAGQLQKIPHIGWRELCPSSKVRGWEGSLLADNHLGDAAYFVHSFMAVPTESGDRLADCVYGGHLIPAVIRRGYITGCQFHPEKSGEVGLKILRKFLFQ